MPAATEATAPPEAPDEAPPAKVCEVTGTTSGGRLASALLRSTIGAAPAFTKAAEEHGERLGAAFDLARAHRPADGVEGAMASLASSLFFGASDLLRRAQAPGMPAEIALQTYKTAARVAETFVGVTEALQRRQHGGARQTVVVQRVVVQDGANAVIGSVAPGGRGDRG